MEKVLIHYQKFTDILLKIILVSACTLIGLDVLLIFLEVSSRYLIGSSQAFMEELPRLLIPFIVFPMMGVLLKLQKHIAVEILPERLRGRNRSLLLIVVYCTVLALAIQFFIAGVVTINYYYEMGFEIDDTINLKYWVAYLPFPIGFGLLILFAIDMLWQELVNLIKQIKGGRA